MKITCLQNAFFYLIFAKLTCQKNYRVARECLRLIDLLLYFPFTTSETKEDFYRQKLNVCVAPVVIAQPETFWPTRYEISKKYLLIEDKFLTRYSTQINQLLNFSYNGPILFDIVNQLQVFFEGLQILYESPFKFSK